MTFTGFHVTFGLVVLTNCMCVCVCLWMYGGEYEMEVFFRNLQTWKGFTLRKVISAVELELATL